MHKFKKINIKYAKQFFTNLDTRTQRAVKNISIAFITKTISIFISFLIVPLTLGYVDTEKYGIWIIIASLITWFNLFDIGLGNGLRNKLAEAIALKDFNLARIYISSTFAIISIISTLLFVSFYFIAPLISWNSFFNTEIVTNSELIRIVLIVFFFFCLDFVLKIVTSILQAIQRYGIFDIINLFSQILGVLGILILIKTTEGSIFYLSLVYASKSVIVMIFASIVLFNGILKQYKPSIKYIQFKKVIPLMNLGFKFFLNQIFYLLMTQSSLFLVAQFYGAEDVTVFSIAVKYVSITFMVFIMILAPFLTAFTEAYTKQDFIWLKKTMKRINMVCVAFSVFTVFIVFGSDFFLKLWVGDVLSIPTSLILALALANILNIWGSTYSLFLNGIGKIKLQIYFLGAQALLFIPLCYLFYKNDFGLISIVIVQIIYYAINLFVYPIQYSKILNKTAKGIWDA